MVVATNLKHIHHWPPEWFTGSHNQMRVSCVEDFEGGRAADAHFTTKGDSLYVILQRWPDHGVLTVRSLTAARCPWLPSVGKVSLLGREAPVKYQLTPDGTRFELPGGKPQPFFGAVLKLQGLGTPVIAPPAPPLLCEPPARQLKLEQIVTAYVLAGDALREKVAVALDDGLCCFYGFVGSIMAVDDGPDKRLHVRSAADPGFSYVLGTNAAQLAEGPFQVGDKIVFAGRYERSKKAGEALGYVFATRKAP
jgi:hypothetical protein